MSDLGDHMYNFAKKNLLKGMKDLSIKEILKEHVKHLFQNWFTSIRRQYFEPNNVRSYANYFFIRQTSEQRGESLIHMLVYENSRFLNYFFPKIFNGCILFNSLAQNKLNLHIFTYSHIQLSSLTFVSFFIFPNSAH